MGVFLSILQNIRARLIFLILDPIHDTKGQARCFLKSSPHPQGLLHSACQTCPTS
ncbi:putative signal peptide protein [Puccinia sorghi]|uniref:Putative signal peptide protein n=1 Tax=Puccinia sorghi TaxID=27349 RepID=A0A0L6V344_9BASI|nr:putative signal peptide protein [Puccinia sorghi]